MPVTDEISVELKIQNEKLRASLKAARKKLKGFTDGAGKPAGSFKQVWETALGVFSGQLLADGLKGLARGLKNLGGSFISEAANAEGYTTRLQTLLGSANKANDLFGQIAKFSAKTPFQIEGLTNATSKLLSFGVAQEDIIDKLQHLGDVAAGSGADIQEIGLIFGQVKAAGKLTGERLLQLQERAIPIGPAIAKTMGIAESSVRQMVKEGKVSFDIFEEVFESLNDEGGKFYEGMVRQSKTFDGVVSTLKDNLSILSQTMGKSLLPAIKAIGIALTNSLGAMTKSAKSINSGDINKMIVSGFIKLVKASRIVILAFDGVFRTISTVIQGAMAAVASLVAEIIQMGSVLGIVSKEFAKVFTDDALKRWKSAGETFTTNTDLAAGLVSMLEELEKNAGRAYSEIAKGAQDAAEANLGLKEQTIELGEAEKARQKDAIDQASKMVEGLHTRMATEEEINAQLQDQREKGLISEEEHEAAKAAIRQRFRDQELDHVQSGLSDLEKAAAMSGKRGAKVAKKIALVNATINTYKAATAAYAAMAGIPVTGPAMAFAAASKALLLGFANVAAIKAAGFQKGVTSVPGIGFGDNFPAILAPKERVVDAQTNEDLKTFLKNANNNPQAIADSGPTEIILRVDGDAMADIFEKEFLVRRRFETGVGFA